MMDRARALVHALTLIHGLGSVAVVSMAAYVLAGEGNADRLAVTPGAQQLVEWTGRPLPAFFLGLGVFLAALAWGSHHRQAWSWPAALVAYSIGVLGSAAEILAGHGRYAVSLLVNGGVVAVLLLPSVRRAFLPPPALQAP